MQGTKENLRLKILKVKRCMLLWVALACVGNPYNSIGEASLASPCLASPCLTTHVTGQASLALPYQLQLT